ncbi:hypothetical protein DFH08DRAFT_826203 [Mycena albidolilacea]|uniref:CCHC-type domain-containing protein n=1 Tax=Mycena albidolilacea TaxID=1033008 RepID=A0AAD7E967_9AGAR|nr:hypothetical protein DFH08DRAFT_826203 [Mycena albidolilacea]
MLEEKIFYGDGRPGESPHNFKKVMQKFMGKGMTDAEKIEALSLGMASGSPADTWFDDPACDAVHKTSWGSMSSAFDTKWPKRAALKRVGQEAIADLLAEKLKAEDIGKRVENGGVEAFSHFVWAHKVARIAGNIPDPSRLFIGVVVEKLPLIMQDLLGPGTVFADWVAFKTVVGDIKHAAIVKAQTKETRLGEMAAAVKSSRNNIMSHAPMQLPTTIHQQHFVPQPFLPYPTFPLPQPQPNYAPPQQLDVGRAAYAQLVSDWHARNGNHRPNELQPYPLTPGTAPLDSNGECFNCTLLGHLTAECTNPAMPPLEKKWHQIAASIRRGTGNVPHQNAPTPVPIQYVANPYNFDPNTAYHYFQQYAPYYHAHGNDEQDQGNGQGSSN